MKVAIVGTASLTTPAVDLDETWEVWGLNDGYWITGLEQRATRWFEIHGDTELTRARRSPDHWDRLGNMTIPVYTLYSLPTVRTAVVLPIEQLAMIRDYFACTMAYQIALAIHEGADAISLYGMPLLGAREAIVERPCVEWWLGYAAGRGITVDVFHDFYCGLGRQRYRYSYDDAAERQQTYAHVCQHYLSATDWIPRERERIAGPMPVEIRPPRFSWAWWKFVCGAEA